MYTNDDIATLVKTCIDAVASTRKEVIALGAVVEKLTSTGTGSAGLPEPHELINNWKLHSSEYREGAFEMYKQIRQLRTTAGSAKLPTVEYVINSVAMDHKRWNEAVSRDVLWIAMIKLTYELIEREQLRTTADSSGERGEG